MKTSEILDKAADVIERNGWHQGDWMHARPGRQDDECPVCEGGALNLAVTGSPCIDADDDDAPADLLTAYEVMAHRAKPSLEIGPEDYTVGELLEAFVEVVASWNDAKGRTAEEVVRELRAAAASEREAGR